MDELEGVEDVHIKGLSESFPDRFRVSQGVSRDLRGI